MNKFLVCFGLFLACAANAKANTTSLASGVSCNSRLNSVVWKKELERLFGRPKVTHSGAVWFSGSGSMWGVPIREAFVSKTTWHGFVGVVVETTPAELVRKIQSSRSFPTKFFQVQDKTGTYWVGADGRKVMWHEQRYAKVFCAAGGNLLNKDY